MAQAIEARVPFLDHELVEYVLKVPPSLKIRGGRPSICCGSTRRGSCRRRSSKKKMPFYVPIEQQFSVPVVSGPDGGHARRTDRFGFAASSSPEAVARLRQRMRPASLYSCQAGIQPDRVGVVVSDGDRSARRRMSAVGVVNGHLSRVSLLITSQGSSNTPSGRSPSGMKSLDGTLGADHRRTMARPTVLERSRRGWRTRFPDWYASSAIPTTGPRPRPAHRYRRSSRRDHHHDRDRSVVGRHYRS